ncbi:MAG: radical SAM protein [Candidatus Omnitrophica bacterium]|nr:radical SAM protein [Candidatus Omnitrophota bacterium]
MPDDVSVSEKIVERLLAPTAIDLAPYVINPYQGCAFGCRFCYAQFSKTARAQSLPWGSYVTVKINALNVLRRELKRLRPARVLLGSTTECFQPIERRYGLSAAILALLVEQRIPVVILTRSPLILDVLALLRQAEVTVYVTVDAAPPVVRGTGAAAREPECRQQIQALRGLRAADVCCVPYVCPVFPGLFSPAEIFSALRGCGRIECELLNFAMAGLPEWLPQLRQQWPEVAECYARMIADEQYYDQITAQIGSELAQAAGECGLSLRMHTHAFQRYFQNRYRRGQSV